MLSTDWNAALNVLRETVPQTQFQNWLKPVEFIRSDDRAVVLGVPSRFHEEWIRNHYAQALCRAIQNQVGQSLQLEFQLLEKESDLDGPLDIAQPVLPLSTVLTAAPAPTPAQRPALRIVDSEPAEEDEAVSIVPEAPQLPVFPNPFVELEYNQVAARCVRMFADGRELQFNPLILFAGVGMGKSHLLTEIGRELHELQPRARIRYTNAETFTNEFFRALQNPNKQEILAFKHKYREDTDCLLFDDIEGLAKKIKTQEELLHIFNDIVGRGGKIAFSTAVPPSRLEGFIEPLKSRLLSGVIAEVKYPSFQERVTLLQKMSNHYGMNPDAGVLRTLADQGQKDVRELIGTLVRLHLQAKIENRPLDQSYLSREGVSAEPRKETISLEEIIVLVEHFYGICRTDLQSKSRKGQVSWARQVAMYLARLHTLLPLEQIGKAFDRDHATVIHSFQKVVESLETEPRRRWEVELLRQKLQGRTARPNGNPV